ncbi:hypothetical protein XELAEV_18001446mg [Xenopus laevis]|nr:hypothetical protein XELAEV_18001446mg [Xenopus laevis]
MIGVGVSVLCGCSVNGLMLQCDWLTSSHEAVSSLIPSAGGGCSAGEISGFERFPLTQSAPSTPILLELL